MARCTCVKGPARQ